MPSSNKQPHESAVYHVTGEAIYIDDMQVSDQLLCGKVVYSPHAHAEIKGFKVDEAKALPGVHAVLDYTDLPGENQMGPVFHDEVVMAEKEVIFVGQAIFLIAAENEDIAEEAAKQAAQEEIAEQANPFEEGTTNPFEGGYENPFEAVNPFAQ